MTGTVPDAEETEVSTIGKRLGYMTLKIPLWPGLEEIACCFSFLCLDKAWSSDLYIPPPCGHGSVLLSYFFCDME